MKKMFLITMSLLGLTACSTMSNLPESDNVEVSRESADEDCEELGKVRGRTGSTTGTAEDALEDLKQEAANKGANYVQVLQYSDNKTAVTGMAYVCD